MSERANGWFIDMAPTMKKARARGGQVPYRKLALGLVALALVGAAVWRWAASAGANAADPRALRHALRRAERAEVGVSVLPSARSARAGRVTHRTAEICRLVFRADPGQGPSLEG